MTALYRFTNTVQSSGNTVSVSRPPIVKGSKIQIIKNGYIFASRAGDEKSAKRGKDTKDNNRKFTSNLD